jgi:ketosteroid isomerase-like protein
VSEESIELARRYCETFNAGGLDGTQHLRHPQVEVYDPPDFPDADRYVGEAAVRQIVESYLELGWDGQFRVEEYRRRGGGRSDLAAEGSYRARGRLPSGADIRSPVPLRGRKAAPGQAVHE